MKLTALLTRQKGRDFYDVLFLWQRTEPDYVFLEERCGIGNKEQLTKALRDVISQIDLNVKKRDFEHLLFTPQKSEIILNFIDLIL